MNELRTFSDVYFAVCILVGIWSFALSIIVAVCLLRIRKESMRIRRALLDVLRSISPGKKFSTDFYDDDDDDDDDDDE